MCNGGSQLSLTYELQLGTCINSQLLFTALIFVQGRSIAFVLPVFFVKIYTSVYFFWGLGEIISWVMWSSSRCSIYSLVKRRNIFRFYAAAKKNEISSPLCPEEISSPVWILVLHEYFLPQRVWYSLFGTINQCVN